MPSARLLVVVLACVSPWLDPVMGQTIEECLQAAIEIDFDITDHERFDEFFTEESVIQIAEGGEYVGPEAIIEYVSFAQEQGNPFIENASPPGRPFIDPVFVPKPSVDGQCEYLAVFETLNRLTPLAAPYDGYVVHIVPMFRIFADPAINKITRINVFYSDTATDVLLGLVFATPQVYGHVCNTLQNNCQSVWEANQLESVDECTAKMTALPTLDQPGSYFDGDTSSCRFFHSILAEINTDHCPHVSFTPIEDVNGAIKCQTSARVPVSDLFEETDLAFWTTTAADVFGVPSGAGAYGPSCTDDSDCMPGFKCLSPEAPSRRLLFSSFAGDICLLQS